MKLTITCDLFASPARVPEHMGTHKKSEVVYKGSIGLEKENANFYHATAQAFCISQKISPEVV